MSTPGDRLRQDQERTWAQQDRDEADARFRDYSALKCAPIPPAPLPTYTLADLIRDREEAEEADREAGRKHGLEFIAAYNAKHFPSCPNPNPSLPLSPTTSTPPKCME